MGILTSIIAGEEEELEAIGESLNPIEEWSGVQMRDIDTAKIATLHCLLTGDLFDDAVAHYEPVHVSETEGVVVLRIADDVMQQLAELDDEAIEEVAAELAATEEFENEEWEDEEIGAMLSDLAQLARLADSQGQALFVWMHPLRT